MLLGPGVAVTFIGRPVYPPTLDRANHLAAVSAGLIPARAYPSSDAHSQQDSYPGMGVYQKRRSPAGWCDSVLSPGWPNHTNPLLARRMAEYQSSDD